MVADKKNENIDLVSCILFVIFIYLKWLLRSNYFRLDMKVLSGHIAQATCVRTNVSYRKLVFCFFSQVIRISEKKWCIDSKIDNMFLIALINYL